VYFHRCGNNLIDWVQKSGETIWKAENLTDLSTDGVEVSANITPEKILKKRSLVRSVNFSYSWLDQGKESGLYSSKYVMDYLKNKVVLGIKHSISGNIGADWTFSYQDRNGNYTKWEGNAFGKEVAYPKLFLTDARIFLQKKIWAFYIEFSNLFDQKYVDYSNVEQPGRWIKFGIKTQIGS
jgi:iron complex outermembrane receptor protein